MRWKVQFDLFMALMKKKPVKNRLQWKIEKNSEERTCNEDMNPKISHISWASFYGMMDSLPSLSHKVRPTRKPYDQPTEKIKTQQNTHQQKKQKPPINMVRRKS